MNTPVSAPAPGRRRATDSLRRRVLRRMILPLGLTWLIGAVVALWVAGFFTRQAYDRAMLDDAYALAINVCPNPAHQLEMLLTPREMNSVLFDPTEQTYFAVRRQDGSLLAGQGDLRAPDLAGHQDPDTAEFGDITYQGRALRAVELRAQTGGLPFSVVMAQTTHARAALLQRLLLYAALPQALLLALLAAWLWRRIARDLAPLGQLQRTLDQRDADDLSPVPVPDNARELERLGTAVNSLLERLAHSIRSQREFAGNVAHELRTPLAGIRALADYGLAQPRPEVWREQLARIAASQERASHLVDQLLGLALADEARAGLQRVPVRLDQLAEQAVLRHLARADARGVDLGARGLDGPMSVLADTALVEGILDNLIDNALRYGVRAGGGTVTVELGADGRTLSVVDDGPGIAPEQQRALMQRWAQGRDGRALGRGAGLGLAIVARYAQLLGAQLTLANDTPEGGLRVSVVFGEGA